MSKEVIKMEQEPMFYEIEVENQKKKVMDLALFQEWLAQNKFRHSVCNLDVTKIESDELLLTQVAKSCSEMLLEIERKFGGQVASQKFYQGKGCEECDNHGYKGRVAIFEVLVITDEIKRLISAKASSGQIRELAVKQGMTLIIQDGLNKVASGLTTIEEVLRAAKE